MPTVWGLVEKWKGHGKVNSDGIATVYPSGFYGITHDGFRLYNKGGIKPLVKGSLIYSIDRGETDAMFGPSTQLEGLVELHPDESNPPKPL